MRASASAATAIALAVAGCGAGASADTSRGVSGGSAGGGTSIVTGTSQYGRILFNAGHQAIYAFSRDGKDHSNCYGGCAQAWPPVYTSGKPRASRGARESLLGTTRRKDGRLQATYAGRPLYYYAHEGPRQVLCHDVNLNGGVWKVIAPDGRRRR
jgi:predicted lipoprotein with Yx(FWY)xxD motif